MLNAGAAIYAAARADSIADGVKAAEQAIDSGAAAGLLDRFVVRSQELGRSPSVQGRPEEARSHQDAGPDAPRR